MSARNISLVSMLALLTEYVKPSFLKSVVVSEIDKKRVRR